MNESALSSESAADESQRDESQRDDAHCENPPPEFGIVDLVEAFTAMRHECRGQIKESRSLTDAVGEMVTTLKELDATRRTSPGDVRTDQARPLVELIVDADHQLTRAVAAADRFETNRKRRSEANMRAIQQSYDEMNVLARWFARPLLTTLTRLHQADEQTTENPAIEGLNLVLARLRRTMKEHQIERVDTLGREFDASLMNAIGTVESAETPTGHVAEQLAPCYLWHEGLLRFADVRVATRQSTSDVSTASAE